jgi:hypothetical protein
MPFDKAQDRPFDKAHGGPSDLTRGVGVLAHHLPVIPTKLCFYGRRRTAMPLGTSAQSKMSHFMSHVGHFGTFWDILGHFGTYKRTHSCYAPLVALQKRRLEVKMSHIGGVVWDIWDIACTKEKRILPMLPKLGQSARFCSLL